MAIPIALALPLLSGVWTNSKWIILVGSLAFSHYYAYSKGAESTLKEQLEGVPAAVAKAERRGVQAVVAASAAVSKLKDEEKAGEDIVEQLEAIPDRTLCKPNTDELRILEEIAARTRRQ